MKNTLLIRHLMQIGVAGAALLSCTAARADYPAEVVGFSPVNYWRLNETGPVPPDILATNLGTLGAAGNGTYVNGSRAVSGALAGETSTAARFPGDNSRVAAVYDASAMGTSTFTVEAWVRPAVSPPPSGQSSLAAVLSCGKLSDPRDGWLVYQSATGWNLRGYTGSGTGTSVNITGGPAPVAGTWYHIAVTFDGSIARVYVNGVEAFASPPVANYAPNSSGAFTVGSRSDVAFPYNGDVDEVAYYTTALSAATIASRYEAGTNASPATPYQTLVLQNSPVIYWRLNEQPYVNLVAVNNGTRGTAANASYNVGVTLADGMRPPAFPGLDAANKTGVFSGPASINAGTNASLNGTIDFTVSAWIKTTSTANGTIIQQRDVDTAVPGYNGEYMFTSKADGTLGFMVYKDGYQFEFATTATVNDGNWHQVTAVRKGLDGIIYIDGVEAGRASGTEVKALVGEIRTFIGRDMRDFINTFDGSIDEVAVWDKALPQGALLSLYYTAIGSNAAPVMVSDPPSVSPMEIFATTSFTITADIAGSLPMTYQWRKNGVVVGTGRDYVKANASVSDSGEYDVIATNPHGTITSAKVTVTVNPAAPPAFVTQPASRFVYPGGNASFTVEATGTAPLTFQWKKGGVNIPGATNQTLVITNVTAAEAGTYSVGVTNVAGGIISPGATLTLRTPAANSYESVVVASGPLNYWRLGESSGTMAYDYAGGADGSHTNVAVGVPGYSQSDSDKAAGYDKSQLSITLAPLVQFAYTGASPTFSLEAWVNFADFQGVQRVFSKGGPGFNGFAFGAEDAGTLRFTTFGVQDFNLDLAEPLQPNTWYHLVGVAKSGRFHFYLNGAEAGSIAFSGAGIAAQQNQAFAIGRNGLGADETVNGTIDEVAVYGKALTPEEIAVHYSAGKYGSTTAPFVSSSPTSQTVVAGSNVKLAAVVLGSQPISYQWKKDAVSIPGATSSTLNIPGAYFTDAGSYTLWATNNVGFTSTTPASLAVMAPPSYALATNGLVLHLKFDGNANDSTGRGNNGTAIGAPTYVPGKLGQALRYKTDPTTGTYDYLTLGTPTDLQFTNDVSFSVAFWIKFTGAPGDLPFLCNNDFSYGGKGLTLAPSYSEGAWSYYINDAAAADWAGIGLYSPSQNTLNNGQWQHLVYSFDRAGVASVYRNGVLENETSIAKASGWNFDTGMPFLIGQAGGAYAEAGTFEMDDMGIWRRALNSYEAASIYAAGQNNLSFDTTGPVTIVVNQVGNNLDIIWQGGTLMQSSTINGTFTAVPGASAPFYRVNPNGTSMFFKVGN